MSTFFSKSTANSLTRKLYLFSFFDEFMLIYPLYALMFQDSGLSGSQISSLFVIFSVVIFLLEVPSGAIADKFSRRNVLLVGIMARAAAFAVWLLFPNYWGFLVGFLLWGIKRAFVSGTVEAFVYDELKRLGRAKSYTKITGMMQTFAMTGFILGGLGASLLAPHGYGPVLILSILAICASAVAIYTLPHTPAVTSTEEVRYFSYLKEGLQTALRHAPLRAIVLFGAMVMGIRVVDEYYNLYLKELHFTNSEIALWIAIIYVFGAFGSAIAHKLEHKRLPAILGIVVWAVLLGCSVVFPPLLAPVCIGLFAMVFYIIKILTNSRLQERTDSKTRATVTSLMGFIAELFALGVFAAFWITSSAGYARGLGIVAVSIFAVAVSMGILRVATVMRKPRLE